MHSENAVHPVSGTVSRRNLLKGALAASAAAALPIFPHVAFAKPTPDSVAANEKVNVACIGIGNRGADDVEGIVKTGHANIVALCDVDMGGKQTEKVLKQFPKVPRFQDFRQMLDKMGNKIDAITAGVPDHAHFPIAMMAMGLGKHVYVEKPMAHTFQEVELMMQAEKKNKVACQMGNQGHSGLNYFQFKAWVDAGIIKNVTKITAFMNMSRRWHGWGAQVTALPEAEEIPKTLDWDEWLATAEFHAYNHKYVQGDWRSWFDFGNGALGDWGAHILDAAHEFLDMGLPEEIDAVRLDGYNKFVFPQASTLLFKFPARGAKPPIDVTWYDGVKNLPPLPSDFGAAVAADDVPPPGGKSETKAAPPGKVIYGEGLTFKGGSHASTLKIIPESKAQEMASKLPDYSKNNSDHYKNFLLACKGQEKCRSSFAIAGPLSQVLVLGVIAQRVNAKLSFDRVTKQITNHPVANALRVGPPPRKDWEHYYKV